MREALLVPWEVSWSRSGEPVDKPAPGGTINPSRPPARSLIVRDPIQEFQDFNRPFAQRNPALLQQKVARMAEGPFAFFRGTFHLFARDVLAGVSAPLPLLTGCGLEMDLVGDIHSENYGTFKADDGLVHYDINDFDETTTGRFDFDVCRLATSLFLAARERKDPLDQVVHVTLATLQTYTDTLHRLAKAKAAPTDFSEAQQSSYAPLDELIRAVAQTKRTAFVSRLTEWKDEHRRLIRSLKYFNLPEDEKTRALRLLADYRSRHPAEGDEFWQVEDVCGRVSGIGSMGRYRYVVLLAGKGSAEARNVLLEFKEARPSAYDLYRQRASGAAALKARAERVITMQRESQTASNRFLGFALDGELSFQVRQLGPHDARLETQGLEPGELEGVGRVQAAILARVHSRSASRVVGLANPLAELADPDAFIQRVLAFALAYADVVQRDWTKFVGARADLDRVEGWAGPKNPGGAR
jgi:uncharacterized protein (DUF2252 family)